MHADLIELAATAASAQWPGRTADRAGRAEWLYAWYLNRTPLPRRSGPPRPSEVDPAAALRAAHAGVGHFTGGWQARSTTATGRAVADRGDDVRHLDPGEYIVPADPGRGARPGDRLQVSECWDWVSDDGFFWYTRHGSWPPSDSDRLVRVYWNCVPTAAPAVIGAITGVVHQRHDYHLKTALPAAHGGRADAAVLYLGPDAFVDVADLLVSTAQGLASALGTTRPRMTAELAPGVGWAEGALAGDSFGQTRADLLAEVLTDPAPDSATIQKVIGAAFTATGLDSARPHLDAEART